MTLSLVMIFNNTTYSMICERKKIKLEFIKSLLCERHFKEDERQGIGWERHTQIMYLIKDI